MSANDTPREKKEKEAEATILAVIPIARGIGTEELSYFTFKRVAPGSLVSVPVRARMVPALVVHAEPASFSKAELRSLPFGLKKIGDVKERALLLPAFVEAARETARYFCTTTGTALAAVTPAALGSHLRGPEHADPSVGAAPSETSPASAPKHLPLLMQAGDDERVAAYRGIIREEFARGGSVFVCLPEITDIERLADALSRGIPEYAFALHSGIAAKKIAAAWDRALSVAHPILIIGTGQFLSIPRNDIRTIIVEKESSRAYKTPARPHIDMRVFAGILARHTKARLVFGDLFLRPETIAREEEGEANEFSPLAFRALTTAERALIDVRAESERGEKPFVVIGASLSRAIGAACAENGHTFVLAGRRGLSPVTICNDCGSVVLCARCSAPMTLHGPSAETMREAGDLSFDKKSDKKTRNFFLCHKCGAREESNDACAVCGGWRFALLGIGAERVERELREMFPHAPVFRMDRDTITTHKKALALREKFYQTPGAILAGTEMAVPYLDRDIHTVAVASVDSLFTIPDFRINERVFSLLLRARMRAQKRVLIQTRDPENRVLRYALDGNMMDFYREEIAERNVFGYPPFTTLIKITREGAERSVRADMESLAGDETLAPYEPRAYESSAPSGKGRVRINLLLKIPRGAWANETLLSTLRALPPQYAITVDPESLL